MTLLEPSRKPPLTEFGALSRWGVSRLSAVFFAAERGGSEPCVIFEKEKRGLWGAALKGLMPDVAISKLARGITFYKGYFAHEHHERFLS
jgi:hypothetical protein